MLHVPAISDCDRLRQVRLPQQPVASEQRSDSTSRLILAFLEVVAVIGITPVTLLGSIAAAAG
jgi:hypothetical protein